MLTLACKYDNMLSVKGKTMKNKKIDISNFVGSITEQSVVSSLVERFKLRRKELKYSQIQLSKRAGVSYGSIKRFEQKGDISLSSLLKLANAMNTLSEFNFLFNTPIYNNLKDL